MERNSLTKAWKTWTTLGDPYTIISIGKWVLSAGLTPKGVTLDQIVAQTVLVGKKRTSSQAKHESNSRKTSL